MRPMSLGSFLHPPLLLAMLSTLLGATSAAALAPSVPSSTVEVRERTGGGLALTFEPLERAPELERLSVEVAEEVLKSFRRDFSPRHSDPRPVRGTMTLASTLRGDCPELGWEPRLRETYRDRYGEPEGRELPLSPGSCRLTQALRMSTRYMKPGAREAAEKLFADPLFLAGLSTSVVVYFLAWAVPEPLFTKSAAATVTLGLVLAFGVVEMRNLGHACLRLYEEVQEARTLEELEAVAERFGKAVGGTALRALVMVASAGVAKGLPQVPRGGLSAMLAPRRLALAEGLTMSSSATAHVVADGTVVLMGASLGTASSGARVTGACGDGSKKDGHWHHIATNKNDVSGARGGPWTPAFKPLFDKAGMSLDDPRNRVYLKGHKGPHSEEYHSEIHETLQGATYGCRSQLDCRRGLEQALEKLADSICPPGSSLYRLLTKT
ncbi:AHH domain-containing protein [Archangium sp.]|uniref:AHH domain-containing protein n=1 Tax=Archangium sp. TaxID=1872627 RepID=UPI00286AB2E2|nr:AHH domain-containing protein [Archangium sp.]